MVRYTKRQIIDHVHSLLAVQFRKSGSTQWKCVLRDGHVQPTQCLRPTDLMIVDCAGRRDSVPLRTLIHRGVNENWDALNAVDMRIQGMVC